MIVYRGIAPLQLFGLLAALMGFLRHIVCKKSVLLQLATYMIISCRMPQNGREYAKEQIIRLYFLSQCA